jgi:hypothetical protein
MTRKFPINSSGISPSSSSGFPVEFEDEFVNSIVKLLSGDLFFSFSSAFKVRIFVVIIASSFEVCLKISFKMNKFAEA